MIGSIASYGAPYAAAAVALIAAILAHVKGNKVAREAASVGMVDANFKENQLQIANLRAEIDYWKAELATERERSDTLEHNLADLKERLKS